MQAPRRRENLHVREIDGETVILDPRNERMHTLNETASFVFGRIDGVRTVSEIARELADEYGIPVETAETDARSAIERLVELGIVG